MIRLRQPHSVLYIIHHLTFLHAHPTPHILSYCPQTCPTSCRRVCFPAGYAQNSNSEDLPHNHMALSFWSITVCNGHFPKRASVLTWGQGGCLLAWTWSSARWGDVWMVTRWEGGGGWMGQWWSCFERAWSGGAESGAGGVCKGRKQGEAYGNADWLAELNWQAGLWCERRGIFIQPNFHQVYNHSPFQNLISPVYLPHSPQPVCPPLLDVIMGTILYICESLTAIISF